MTSLIMTKKIFGPILLGSLSILLGKALWSLVTIYFLNGWEDIFPSILEASISTVLVVLSGALTGWLIKEKGLIYGGLAGVVSVIPFLLLNLVFLFLPTPNGILESQKYVNIFQTLTGGMIVIIQASIGGILGEDLHRRFRV